jgi:hypothetical protein
MACRRRPAVAPVAPVVPRPACPILLPAPAPKWRNWQTRYVQGVVGVLPSGFESLLRHLVEFKTERTFEDFGSAWREDLELRQG